VRWVFQGIAQAPASNVNFSTPTTNAATASYNTGTEILSPSAQFAPRQSAQYVWVSVLLPATYAANQPVHYVLETSCDIGGVCDSSRAARIYLGVAFPGANAPPFDPAFTDPSAPVTLTSAPGGATTYTAGDITPGANGLPSTSGGRQRIWIRVRADLLSNAVTGLLLQSMTLYL
jgi:hypothetical protein